MGPGTRGSEARRGWQASDVVALRGIEGPLLNYKEQFADFEGRAYLNCAYQGPFPRVTSDAIREAIQLKEQPYRIAEELLFSVPEDVRTELGGLLGASPRSFAVTNGASDGIFAVARGLEWRSGDQVLLAGSDFPSNFYSWSHLKAQGVESVIVPADALVARLGPRTRVLCVSWVSYNDGLRMDLRKLGEACRANGTLFVVDLSQGAGAQELRLEDLPVDVAVGCGYKWLLSPYGTGYAYFTPGALEQLRVVDVYWEAIVGAENFNRLPRENWRLVEDARRFDSVETASFLNLYGLRASLRFLRRVGPASIERHVQELFAYLIPRLPEGFRTSGTQSTILGIEGRDPQATAQAYARAVAAKVMVSLRQDRLRVSPQLYNTVEDMDRLLQALRG